MFDFERIAERRIAEALARGEFDNLPGKGKPLELDDDVWVPPDQRLAYRILKNAGFTPREVQIRKDVAEARALLEEPHGRTTRSRNVRRLNLLLAQLDALRHLK